MPADAGRSAEWPPRPCFLAALGEGALRAPRGQPFESAALRFASDLRGVSAERAVADAAGEIDRDTSVDFTTSGHQGRLPATSELETCRTAPPVIGRTGPEGPLTFRQSLAVTTDPRTRTTQEGTAKQTCPPQLPQHYGEQTWQHLMSREVPHYTAGNSRPPTHQSQR